MVPNRASDHKPTLFRAAEVEVEGSKTEKLLLSLSVLMSGCLILRTSYIVGMEEGISHFA